MQADLLGLVVVVSKTDSCYLSACDRYRLARRSSSTRERRVHEIDSLLLRIAVSRRRNWPKAPAEAYLEKILIKCQFALWIPRRDIGAIVEINLNSDVSETR